jgi:hypothetical protein
LARLRIEELRKQQATDAAKKKADDEARTKAEAERQRVAMLQEQEAETAKRSRPAVRILGAATAIAAAYFLTARLGLALLLAR